MSGSKAKTGQTLTDPIPQSLTGHVDEVISEAYHVGISVNGDFYRSHAFGVGVACSHGFLTTESHGGYGRVYRPTLRGMEWYLKGGVST